ncbi:hypothetical protein OBBRIDRAFT_128236 [Obba rivulosa]|uniref:Uncharacterized protein n=1 Tax=Obba rivulosa TaxID=1052685 RepID=A0A8E2AWC8_9APHY|nr:hypothetical protein OBBRIDRAFT_128236 [Obba rivulosa]
MRFLEATLLGPRVVACAPNCQDPRAWTWLSLRLLHRAARKRNRCLCNSLASFPEMSAKRYALLSRHLHLILYFHSLRSPSTFLFWPDNAASFHSLYGTSYVLWVLEIALTLGASCPAARSVPDASRKPGPYYIRTNLGCR